MKSFKNSKHYFAWGLLGLFIFSGTYNAIVINSQSSLQGYHVSHSKRLDELYGEIDSKREVAAAMQWQKLSIKQSAIHKKTIVKNKVLKQKEAPSFNDHITSEAIAPQAAVQEELSLQLTAVSNPQIWKQGIGTDSFSGSLQTNNGVIESLEVSLPNGGVSVSFSEMTGNVFEYDMDGEVYSGMMYQDASHSYVVNLTNGPLAGTKLSFTKDKSEEEIQAQNDQAFELAQNQDAEAGIHQENANQQEMQSEEVAQNEAQPALENMPKYDQEYQRINPYAVNEQGLTYDEMLQQQAMMQQNQVPNV